MLKPMSDVSVSIRSGKNFLFSIYSLSYRLFNLIIFSFYFLLYFVTTNYSSYRGSFGYSIFLYVYFIIRYVSYLFYMIFVIYLRNFWYLTFYIVIILLFFIILYKSLDSNILFYNIL